MYLSYLQEFPLADETVNWFYEVCCLDLMSGECLTVKLEATNLLAEEPGFNVFVRDASVGSLSFISCVHVFQLSVNRKPKQDPRVRDFFPFPCFPNFPYPGSSVSTPSEGTYIDLEVSYDFRRECVSGLKCRQLMTPSGRRAHKASPDHSQSLANPHHLCFTLTH